MNLLAERGVAVLAVEPGETEHDVGCAGGARESDVVEVLRGEGHEGVEEVVDEQKLLLRHRAALEPLHALVGALRRRRLL